MSPDQSIYQQYKHDTEVVASWLATTAQAFGWSSQLGEPSTRKTAAKPSGRLKGKERKKAKEAQLRFDELPELPGPSKPKCTFAIKDLVPLAEHIIKASNAADIRVPRSFSVALRRGIWVRRSFAERLEHASHRFDFKSDARHSFFINVLEKVRKTLEPLLRVDAFNLSTLKDAVPDVGSHSDNRGLSSLFKALDVYKPFAGFKAASDVVVPAPSGLEYTVEAEEDPQFEALFAMTALMDDLSGLRLEIAGLWTRYEAGEADIAAVSVATNTAIELARSFEVDISPFMQANGGSSRFHTKYFHAISQAFGIDAEAMETPNDDYNFAAYDVADTLLINTLINIIEFVRANPLGKMPSYNGSYGWYDEASVQTTESGRQKYNRIKPAIFELLSDLPLISDRPSPVEDQLMLGMMSTLTTAKQEQKETPDVPIWFSFAVQVYLDTLKIVKIGKGWHDMQTVMYNCIASVDDLATSCPERKEVLKVLDLWTRKIDPIAVMQNSLGRPYIHFTFFRRHFMHCGLAVHYIRTVFHQQGVVFASVPGIVLCTTQLYHALQQEKYLNHAWTDLDRLRRMQGDSTFFVSEPPSSFEGYFNNFCLTMGSSITDWAQNKSGKVKASKENKPLMMRSLGLTSELIAHRISPSGDRRPLPVEVVEDWIQKFRKGQGNVEAGIVRTATVKNKQIKYPLLDSLAHAVAMEIEDLDFDYFSLHNLCLVLLLRLQTEEEKITGPGFTKKYMAQGEQNLAIVVGFVFSTAAGKKDVLPTTESPTRLLEIAAETVNQWVLEKKGEAITYAYKFYLKDE